MLITKTGRNGLFDAMYFCNFLAYQLLIKIIENYFDLWSPSLFFFSKMNPSHTFLLFMAFFASMVASEAGSNLTESNRDSKGMLLI
jgi:hypothetical protein